MLSAAGCALAWLAAAADATPPQAAPEEESSVDAMEGRVHAQLAAQRWREALAEARAFAERQPDEPRLRSLLGEALLRAGRLEEAEAVLGPLADLETVPAPRGLVALGRLREARGEPEAAARLMSRAVRAAPDDRDVLYWAAGSAPTRGAAVELLERYLAHSAGDDPDRIEAASRTAPILRLLGERPIWVTRARPERLELPLERVWDPESGATQGFVLQVRIGERGKPVRLLLDSGAPGLLVLERIARRRGFEDLGAKTSFGGGGDERHETRRVVFSSVEVGGLRFADALATTTRDEIDPTGRFHGLLGLAVFSGYRVTLDLDAGRLRLEPASAVAAGAPYWMLDGQMLVRAGVGAGRGGDAEDTALFLLDTGATRTMVDAGLARAIGSARTGEAADIRGVGGRITSARTLEGLEVSFEALRSGSRQLRAVDLALRSRLGGVEIGGMLGLDLLDHGWITIDPRARRVSVREPRGRRRPASG
jgi:hypothetical protein